MTFATTLIAAVLLIAGAPAARAATQGPQNFSNSAIADAGLRHNGEARATGWDAPGECIKWVQTWVREAGGSMSGGGTISAYQRSPATEVGIGEATRGDVFQISIGDSYDGSPHTGVLLGSRNADGTFPVVEGNVPAGSGRVRVVNRQVAAPGGHTLRFWRFGKVSSDPGPQPPAPTRTEANLLKDGGFENGGAGWKAFDAPGGKTNFVTYQNPDMAYDGTRYAEVNSSRPDGSLNQDIGASLATGDSATFSVWGRLNPGNSSTGKIRLCLWTLDGGARSACRDLTLTATWQRVQATATAPRPTTQLRAEIYFTGTGNLNLDGATVSRNLLRDGGFENGGTGWAALSTDTAHANFAAYENGALAAEGGRYGEANTTGPGGSIVQDVGADMGTDDSATFSIWARVHPDNPRTGQRVGVCLWTMDGGPRSACREIDLTKRWQQVQVTATAPRPTTHLRAQVYLGGSGNMDFDGATVTKSLLKDGGFENAGAGWRSLTPGSGITNFVTYENAARAYDGTHFAEANTNPDGGSVYQDIPVTMATDDSATFSIWARVSPDIAVDGQAVGLCLWTLDGTPRNSCRTLILSRRWQLVQATATAPRSTTALRAQIYLKGPGNINLDGASLGAPQGAPAVYKPVSTKNPKIDGPPSEGATLRCGAGSWSDAPDSVVTVMLRDGAPFGAGETHTLSASDAGHRFGCRSTASNAAGDATADSDDLAIATSPSDGTPVVPSGAATPVTPASPTPTPTATAPETPSPPATVPAIRGPETSSPQAQTTPSACRLVKNSVRRPARAELRCAFATGTRLTIRLVRGTGSKARSITKHVTLGRRGSLRLATRGLQKASYTLSVSRARVPVLSTTLRLR